MSDVVALYARVSRKDQNISQQLKQLKDFCKRRGFKFRSFTDLGVSGALNSRPGWDKFIKSASTGGFKCLIVQRLDRLTRDSLYAEGLLHFFKVLDIKLISLYEGEFDFSDPDRCFNYRIISLLNQKERETLISRTRVGLDRARSEGKRLGGSRVGRRYKK